MLTDKRQQKPGPVMFSTNFHSEIGHLPQVFDMNTSSSEETISEGLMSPEQAITFLEEKTKYQFSFQVVLKTRVKIG